MAATRALSPFKFLTAPIRLVMADPRVAGPLLVAILYFPEKLQSILPSQLYPYITSLNFVRSLKFFLGLNVVGRLNAKLSDLTLNNWKGPSKFVKSQEVVLITGGSSGIGDLVTRAFAKMGVKVIIADLNPPKNPIPGVPFYQLDVTSTTQISTVAAEIRASHGDPTVLINNAGIGYCATILGGTEAGIRKTFEVNTMAHFWMVREFLPAMIRKDHGHVVTVASMASFIVHSQNVDYACTKVAALAFHEGLAVELRSRYSAPNVKTSIIHPAWVNTPLIEPLTSNPNFKDKVIEPEVVVSAIVKQVLAGSSGQIILPPEVSNISMLRAWPSWMQEYIRNKIAHVLAINKEGNPKTW